MSNMRALPTCVPHGTLAGIRFWITIAVTGVILASAVSASAQEDITDWLSVGGLLFGDLYHVVSHRTEEGEGATGVVVRRGYLTFDGDFSEQLFGRLRFEVNQAGEFETYTFSVDFKDLYLGWNVGHQRLLFGLSPTPTFDLFESIWGLRYMLRTPMDLQGEPSRDTGISAKGPLNAAGTLSYRAMVGAGTNFGNESGDGRRWMGALTWKPSSSWTLEGYADYERLPGSVDHRTLQAFLAYQTEPLRWSLLYSHQDRQDDPPLKLASAFVVGRVGARTNLVARVDRLFEPSPRGDNIAYIPFDPTARATFFIAGVEFLINEHLRIAPNAYVTTYDRNDQGVRPTTDFALRLALFLDFE